MSETKQVEISTYDKKTLSLFDLEGFWRHLKGNALTVIDACIPAKEQNKAAKSLMRQAIDSKIAELEKWVYDCEKAKGPNWKNPPPSYPFNSPTNQ